MIRLYRVVPWVEGAQHGRPGHPLFVDSSRQGGGRADNPRHYRALYLSESAAGAVGETFGDHALWTGEMFWVPGISGAKRALATFVADPPPRVLDLDDAATLVRLGVRPTEVVGRDREKSREMALTVWLEGAWEGLRWWSWWRPAWRNQVLWTPLDDDAWPIELAGVEELDVQHPAVVVAAEALRRRVA